MSAPTSSSPSQPQASHAVPIHGRFLWHELLATEVDSAAAFYTSVAGWGVAKLPNPDGRGTYTMLLKGEAGQAGVTTFPPQQAKAGIGPRWVPYMGTDDTDATCRQAVALGGTEIIAPMDIPTIGRMALLADPEGALFSVITPFPAGMTETVPTVGEFAWHEMIADDPDAALAFYRRLFGWEVKHSMDMGEHGMYIMFGRGEFMYGGFMRGAPGVPSPAWNCYIRVADLEASCEAIRQGGGKIMMGPHDIPNDDRVVIAVDPQGAMFSLVSGKGRTL